MKTKILITSRIIAALLVVMCIGAAVPNGMGMLVGIISAAWLVLSVIADERKGA